MLPLLYAEGDGLLWYITGLLIFWFRFKHILSSQSVSRAVTWVWKASYIWGHLLNQGHLERTVLETPLCRLQFVSFFFNWRILSAEEPKFSSLLCCNPHTTEKSSFQEGINPLLCPIQTQGLPLCRSFQIPKAYLVGGSAGCTKGQCTNRIQHWERTGL